MTCQPDSHGGSQVPIKQRVIHKVGKAHIPKDQPVCVHRMQCFQRSRQQVGVRAHQHAAKHKIGHQQQGPLNCSCTVSGQPCVSLGGRPRVVRAVNVERGLSSRGFMGFQFVHSGWNTSGQDGWIIYSTNLLQKKDKTCWSLITAPAKHLDLKIFGRSLKEIMHRLNHRRFSYQNVCDKIRHNLVCKESVKHT